MRHLRHLLARQGEEIPRRLERPRILMGAFVVAALACAWWFDSTTCPIAWLFGVPCPGCGLGRATLALVSGHPIEALRLYPLVFVVLPALVVFVALPSARTARKLVGLVTFPPTRPHRNPPRGQAPETPSAASQSLGAGSLRSLGTRDTARWRWSPPRGEPPGPPATPRKASARARFAREETRTVAAAAILIAVVGVWLARFGGAFGGPVAVRAGWTAIR